MKTMTVEVSINEIRDTLYEQMDRQNVERISELNGDRRVEIEGEVDADDCINVAIDCGYIHGGDALDGLNPSLRDLCDGLRDLIAGDRDMAAILLSRALSEWPDAVRVVEETLGGRTCHDRRQLTLLAA